jgi:brefeldin A-resistance guanine nucleotide exchange factor 1
MPGGALNLIRPGKPSHNCLDTLSLTRPSSSVIDRGRKAVDLMFEILKYISSLTENRTESRDKSLQGFRFDAGHLPADLGILNTGRHQLTLTVLVSLSRQSTSASSEVRHSALSSLSRAILGPLVVVSRTEVADVFQRVLYPLLEALIVAPGNIETTESRLRASVLLCKAFMRFEVSDNVTGEDVTECWMQVLDYLGRLIRIDQSEQLVRFSFLSDTRNGRLMPPPSPRQCTSHSKM